MNRPFSEDFLKEDNLVKFSHQSFSGLDVESLLKLRELAWRQAYYFECVPEFQEVAEMVSTTCEKVLRGELETSNRLNTFSDSEMCMLLDFFSKSEQLFLFGKHLESLQDQKAIQQRFNAFLDWFDRVNFGFGYLIGGVLADVEGYLSINDSEIFERYEQKRDKILDLDSLILERESFAQFLEIGMYDSLLELVEDCEIFRRQTDFSELIRSFKKKDEVFGDEFKSLLEEEYGMSYERFRETIFTLLVNEILRPFAHEFDLHYGDGKVRLLEDAELTVKNFTFYDDPQLQELLVKTVELCLEYVRIDFEFSEDIRREHEEFEELQSRKLEETRQFTRDELREFLKGSHFDKDLEGEEWKYGEEPRLFD